MLNSTGQRIRSWAARARLNCLGRWQYIRGRKCSAFTLAYETFHDLLDLESNSFSGHFYLGQIARQRGQARLAFDHYLAAYRSSRSAFNRSNIPDDLKNHIALRHGLTQTSPMIIHEPNKPQPSQVAEMRESRQKSDFLVHPEIERHPSARGTLPFGDFRDSAEVELFAKKSPISAEELETVDWDDLIFRLQSDQS